jgi:hypothetical protein
MPSKTIELPSGFTGEVRNLKAKELSHLADPQNGKARGSGKKKIKAAHPLDPVYNGCWVKTIDPGPYGFSVGEPVPWPKIILADRFVALLHMRDLTWGGYEFKVRCQNANCERNKKPFVWEIDINELDYKMLPDESREKVKQGNLTFDLVIDSKACQFRLMTGEDEANAPTLSDDVPGHKKILAQVAARLIAVEGFDVTKDSEKVIDWVGDLDLSELYRASKAMDEVDGGAETRTVVECPSCGLEFSTDIPFGDSAFLTPPQK